MRKTVWYLIRNNSHCVMHSSSLELVEMGFDSVIEDKPKVLEIVGRVYDSTCWPELQETIQGRKAVNGVW